MKLKKDNENDQKKEILSNNDGHNIACINSAWTTKTMDATFYIN